jgi:hypothetical protein
MLRLEKVTHQSKSSASSAEAEVLLSQGNTIGITCKKIEVSEFTYNVGEKNTAACSGSTQAHSLEA